MSMLDGKTLKKAQLVTHEEQLQEAKAWGFKSIKDFYKTMEEAEEIQKREEEEIFGEMVKHD